MSSSIREAKCVIRRICCMSDRATTIALNGCAKFLRFLPDGASKPGLHKTPFLLVSTALIKLFFTFDQRVHQAADVGRIALKNKARRKQSIKPYQGQYPDHCKVVLNYRARMGKGQLQEITESQVERDQFASNYRKRHSYCWDQIQTTSLPPKPWWLDLGIGVIHQHWAIVENLKYYLHQSETAQESRYIPSPKKVPKTE